MSSARVRNPRPRGTYQEWTAAEEDYLLDHYGVEPVKAIAAYLGRPASSVSAKAGSLRMTRLRIAPVLPSNPWNLDDQELNVLVAMAGGLSNRGIGKVMKLPIESVEKIVKNLTDRMVSPVQKQVRDFEPRCILVRRFLREGGPLLKRLH